MRPHARVEWSPDGQRYLILRAGELEIRKLDGEHVRTLAARPVTMPNGTVEAATYLDARWLADGRIAAVDRFGIPMMFSMRGEAYGTPNDQRYVWDRSAARIAAAGTAYVLFDRDITVHSTAPTNESLWRWHYAKRWYDVSEPISGTEIAPDGLRLALAHAAGWLVLDLSPPTSPSHLERVSGTWRAIILGRGDTGHVAFAKSGRWVVTATPAIVDAHGVRTATIEDDRVRVDYLDASGSLVIEPGIGALVAIAFGPGDRIACLAHDGAVEIVPIP